MKRFLLFIIFVAGAIGLHAQERAIDSLKSSLAKAKQDTAKIRLLNIIAEKQMADNPDSALSTARWALGLSDRNTFHNGQLKAHSLIAKIYFNLSNYDSAIANYQRAIAMAQPSDSQQELYTGLGNVYLYKGDYPKSLDNIFKGLKIAESRNDKPGMAACYMNIANVFLTQKELDKSLDYNMKALKIAEELNNNALKEKVYYTIGNFYAANLEDEKALTWLNKSLELNKQMNSKSGMAYAYNAIGSCNENLGRHQEALDCFKRSAALAASIGDKRVQTFNLITMAYVYNGLKQYPQAIDDYKTSIALAKEIGASDIEMESLGELELLYKKIGRDHEALETYEQLIALRDTVMNQEKAKELVRKEMNYEFDKKQAIAKAENEKIQLKAEEEQRRQRLVIIVVLVILVIVIVFSVFIYRSLQQNKQKSRIIEQQKIVVESKNHEIEEKQREILDSISYAKRIQQALLPPLPEVKAALPGAFILFKPKDIVSGDFYWFAETADYTLIAAADCTGHGVPGAFMSTLGTEQLNDAVKHTSNVSMILNRVNRGIKKVLRQNDGADATRDGMDIALCAFRRNGNKLSYAGANRPIWIIRNNSTVLEEIKATKTAIGGHTRDEQEFTAHEIDLQQGDSIYIFSDGFADQFGRTGKKLMTKNFKEILMNIAARPAEEQQRHLDEFIESWRGGAEQTDDILVIGIKA